MDPFCFVDAQGKGGNGLILVGYEVFAWYIVSYSRVGQWSSV